MYSFAKTNFPTKAKTKVQVTNWVYTYWEIELLFTTIDGFCARISTRHVSDESILRLYSDQRQIISRQHLQCHTKFAAALSQTTGYIAHSRSNINFNES